MANINKGEVEFTSGKKVYTLSFSTNAMCDLEDRLGKSIVEIGGLMSDTSNVRITLMRTIFWAGLRDHHEAMTEVEAGRLMDAVGLIEASQMIAKAFAAAFPEAPANGPLPEPAPRSKSTGKAH
jgi:hypothetical protein